MKKFLTTLMVWILHLVITAIWTVLFTILFEKMYEKIQTILENRRNRKEAKCQ